MGGDFRAIFLEKNMGYSTGYFSEIGSFFKMTIINVSENVIKMENSLLVIFGEIWPKSLYYSTWSLAQFLSNFKNS